MCVVWVVVVVAVVIACQWARVETVVGVVVIHQWRKVCFDMIVLFVSFGCFGCGLDWLIGCR